MNVLNIRLNSRGSVRRSQCFASGPDNVFEKPVHIGQAPDLVVQTTSWSAFFARSLKNFIARLRISSIRLVATCDETCDEEPFALRLRPTADYLIVAVPPLRLAAVDHIVVEQIVMAGAFPDLRMHDDRAVQPGHLVGRRGPFLGDQQFVVSDVTMSLPPGFADVSLQLHPHRTVVPEAVQAAVNLARLKKKSASLAQRDQLLHFHNVFTLQRIGQGRGRRSFNATSNRL